MRKSKLRWRWGPNEERVRDHVSHFGAHQKEEEEEKRKEGGVFDGGRLCGASQRRLFVL